MVCNNFYAPGSSFSRKAYVPAEIIPGIKCLKENPYILPRPGDLTGKFHEFFAKKDFSS